MTPDTFEAWRVAALYKVPHNSVMTATVLRETRRRILADVERVAALQREKAALEAKLAAMRPK